AVIDLKGAFTYASCYVALSRVRTLSGIALSSMASYQKIVRASGLVTKEYDRLRVLMTRLPALDAPRLPSIQKKRRSKPRSSSTSTRQLPKDYVVEDIIRKRIDPTTGLAEYEVKWLGWDSSDNTWEPRRNLRHCDVILQRFEKRVARRVLEPSVRPPKARKTI
ncbi:MAG: chromo domain-containing protein, partial [Candidatus Pacebacteria bacterium]|nr:chromo domain-containing protein [Candidatus Paceibacterota bacterium]